MKNNCIYFAEGKCEERLLNALKDNPQKIQSESCTIKMDKQKS